MDGRTWITLSSGERARIRLTEDEIIKKVTEHRKSGTPMKLPGVEGLVFAEHVVRILPEDSVV